MSSLNTIDINIFQFINLWNKIIALHCIENAVLNSLQEKFGKELQQYARRATKFTAQHGCQSVKLSIIQLIWQLFLSENVQCLMRYSVIHYWFSRTNYHERLASRLHFTRNKKVLGMTPLSNNCPTLFLPEINTRRSNSFACT
jgi:hypothetical protein